MFSLFFFFFALLSEKHCFTSWLIVSPTSKVISFRSLHQSFWLFLMLTSYPATLVLSKRCVGSARDIYIYMAFVVGWSTGWHRLGSVPVDLTEWLPGGRKVLSSDLRVLTSPYCLNPTCTAYFHPAQISSLFFFLLSPALSSRCIWLMHHDPLFSPR